MSLPRETVLELMALADGELEGDAKARAEGLVGAHAEARRFVEAIESAELRGYLESDAERAAAAAGADSIAASVVARLRAASSPAPPLPFPARRTERIPRSDGRLRVATVGFAVALAAGVALSLGRHAPLGEEAPVAKRDLAPPAATEVAAPPLPTNGVEVDEIDSPAHDISVFEITGTVAVAAANPARLSSVVIWVEDGTGSK